MYFFNSKLHLQKAFFAKTKIDHGKWPFVIKNASKSVFFFFSKYVDVGTVLKNNKIAKLELKI